MQLPPRVGELAAYGSIYICMLQKVGVMCKARAYSMCMRFCMQCVTSLSLPARKQLIILVQARLGLAKKAQGFCWLLID
jgi:hypothetical protein